MSNVINTPVHARFDNASRHGSSGGNKVGKYVKELLDKNGIGGNVEIERDGEGRIVVLNDHKQKAQIEDLLNNDSRLASVVKQPSAGVKEIDSKEPNGWVRGCGGRVGRSWRVDFNGRPS